MPGTPRCYLCHERDNVFETNAVIGKDVVFKTSNIYPLLSVTVGAPPGHLEPHPATTRCRNSVFQAT
jgi:hypothetical protein